MKAAVRKKWVAALRSGEFKQGRGQLLLVKTSGEKLHCCLGVLCELHRRATRPKRSPWKYYTDEGCASYLDNTGALPPDVFNWAGLDGQPSVTYAYTDLRLSELNDGQVGKRKPLTFEQIAKLIERQL